jgi:hypothetical protein
MISAWEKVRPNGVQLPDWKTGEMTDFLFLYRLTVVGQNYLNNVLIPTLCRKAGLPTADVRGNITSHRGRSTIASQLFNAKEPMTLFELQEWLGHSTPAATQHYAKLTPTKLAKSYADAGRLRFWLTRNLSVTDGPQPSHGGSTTWGMATAPMISSSSARIEWHAQSATSTLPNSRVPHSF